MRIFVTGATGFVGSTIVSELRHAGYQVLGLARPEGSAEALNAVGAEVHKGDLEDLDSLRRGAALSDGVIHAAFDHDFSRSAENSEIDRCAIEAMGKALAGSEKPLIATAGLPPTPGHITTEDDVPPSSGATPRVSEQTALSLIERGVRASVVRISQVHDQDKQGFASYLIPLAREKGVSAYLSDGDNRWAAVHRLGTAPLYRLALEQGVAGARYHAVAEEGVAVREIAEAIAQGLELPVVALSPEEAAGHFGWLGSLVGMDAPASSALTQERLGWHPEKPNFLTDLERANAFET